MSENEIRTGFWIDHDKSPTVGATLTVTNDQASYLIAFLSFLLTTVLAGSVWKILVFCIYHARSLPPDTNLAVDQRWVILRNSESPLIASYRSLKSFWNWRKSGTPRRLGLVLKLLFPSCVVIVILLGGIVLPPIIVSESSNEIIVLSKAGDCGFRRPNLASVDDVMTRAAVATRELEETTDGRRYATERYGNITSTFATRPIFPAIALPFTTDKSAPCPFSDKMCLLGSNSAIAFDTGLLDSHTHLGINAPAGDRVQYRWMSTCTPLSLESSMVEIVSNGTRDGFVISKDEPLFDVFLGEYLGKSYTISWKQNIIDPSGYQVRTVSATRGLGRTEDELWKPIDSLNRTDADLSLIFIATNFISYAEKAFDPVFQANGTKQGPDDDGRWYSDWTFRFIACAEQHQFCNPNTGSCTMLDGVLGDSFKPFIDDGISQQFATATRLSLYADDHYIENSIKSLGSNALIAQSVVSDQTLTAPGLPDDQWQRETQRWFETGLAKFQFKTMEFADMKFTSRDAAGYRPTAAHNYSNIPEMNAALASQCSTQRIRSTGQVQNFSFLGLIILVGVTTVVGALALAIEWIGRRLIPERKRDLWARDDLLAIWRARVDPHDEKTWTDKNALVRVDASAPVPKSKRRNHPFRWPRLASVVKK